MEFSQCRAHTKSIFAEVAENYPVDVIVDTGIAFTINEWFNDGAVTATCPKWDRQMVLAQAHYR